MYIKKIILIKFLSLFFLISCGDNKKKELLTYYSNGNIHFKDYYNNLR